MNRRLSTIMAADLVGYSRLVSADEDKVIAKLRRLRSEIIDPMISEHDGRIVKTMGDGVLVEFGSSSAAVRMAVALQDRMQKLEAAEAADDRFLFRIGINSGEVVVDGEDVLGDCVNIAARLESLAPPGGICLGRTVFELVDGKIDAKLTPLGPQQVKNIPHPIDAWRVEIDGVATQPATTSERDRASIAVLPFDNMSSDPEQDFLADGIVEDVITELSRFRDLFVMARNSSFAYKGTSKDVRQIAKELGVEYVVEGSVRRAGSRLRVTAQLIEAGSGTHVWADRWDRTIEDLFELQDELTGAIVSAVQPELGAHERALTLSKPVESLSVWELCHRASDWQTRIDAEKFDECERLLRRALELEPDNVRALVHFSRLQVSRVFLGIGRDQEAELADCLTAGQRAVELDRRNDEAHRANGISLVAAGRFDEALNTIESGLALNPNNSGLHYSRGFCWLRPPYEFPDRVEADMNMAQKLSPRDPLKVHCYGLTAQAWLASGKPGCEDKALAAFERASHEANTIWPYVAAAAALNAKLGNIERARYFLLAAISRKPDVTVAQLPNALPNPWWRASWARIADAGELLKELGLPGE